MRLISKARLLFPDVPLDLIVELVRPVIGSVLELQVTVKIAPLENVGWGQA